MKLNAAKLVGDLGRDEAVGVSHVETLAQADADELAGSLLSAGVPPGQAAGHAAAAFGEAAARSAFARVVRGLPGGPEVMSILADVAEQAPDAANAWLAEVLSRTQNQEWRQGGASGFHLEDHGWITSLPAGLKVRGNLYLTQCKGLKVLPDGLKVHDDLWLAGCASLERLPDGLSVGRDLDIQGCVSWDGRFPDDMKVGGLVFDDAHPQGMPLWTLRELDKP